AKIGGTSHIPISSLRMKMIRDGQEDYEYLKMVSDAGDRALADTEAAGLSQNAYTNSTDPAAIDGARHRIALRIEALTGPTPPHNPPLTGAGVLVVVDAFVCQLGPSGEAGGASAAN